MALLCQYIVPSLRRSTVLQVSYRSKDLCNVHRGDKNERGMFVTCASTRLKTCVCVSVFVRGGGGWTSVDRWTDVSVRQTSGAHESERVAPFLKHMLCAFARLESALPI